MPRIKSILLFLLLAFCALLSAHLFGTEEFTFAVFGDSRPGKDLKLPGTFPAIIDAINRSLPDAVFHTGDIIYGKTDETTSLERQYSDFYGVAGQLKMKLFIAPGNHDIWDVNSAEIFKEHFGYLYTSVTYGKNHFILLNSELPHHECTVEGEQLAWLEKDLRQNNRKGMNIFIFIHRPMFPVDGYKGKSMDRYPKKRDQLHGLFKRYGVRYVFSGHEHIFNITEKDGITYIITGGGGARLYADEDKGGFYHLMLFKVKGKEVSFDIMKFQDRNNTLGGNFRTGDDAAR